MTIFENEYLVLTEENNKVFFEPKKPGFTLKDFDMILRENPRLKLTNFNALKDGLEGKKDAKFEVGHWLPNMDVEIARDGMTASLFIYEKQEDIKNNQVTIKKDIAKLLADKGIVTGIIDVPLTMVMPSKAILIAKGREPKNGEDAKITYLPKPEKKPVIKDDDKADYYDMNFIKRIAEDTWLAEKQFATPGVPGATVLGEPVPAKPGKDLPLRYDKKSTYEEETKDKLIIRSRIEGVLEEDKGMIKVSRHLPIKGDVGIETGNLQFDGSVSISGTITSGFKVVAKGDISIDGAEGVSGAELIHSIGGDIFIKGGIFGLGKTKVEAAGSIFVKHVNQAELIAGETIDIGSYALGSKLYAKTIKVNEQKGKLMGGEAVAKSTITAAITGNRLERRTDLIIESISKQESYNEIQNRATALKELQEEINSAQETVNRLKPFVKQLSADQMVLYEQARQVLIDKMDEALIADHEIKSLMEVMRLAGKEEINITKVAHPGTYIQIGKKSSLFTKEKQGKFKLEFGELNV